MEWNLLAGAQLLFFGLGAWYFWKSSRRKGAGEGLRCEDNIVEMDKLMAMEETKLTEPLAEQTRPRTLEEIIGQENGIKALRAALCGPNPQHILIYGPPGVGKTAAARLILEEAKKREGSPFGAGARFVEIDATTLQFDCLALCMIRFIRAQGHLATREFPDRVRGQSAKRTAACCLLMKSGSCIRYR